LSKFSSQKIIFRLETILIMYTY